MEETSLLEPDESRNLLEEPPKKTIKKILNYLGLSLVFIVGFIFGLAFFFKPDILINYYSTKQNLPFEIDQLDFGFSGGFEFERLRYNIELTRGVRDRLQVEYGKGDISLFGFLFGNKLKFETNLTGVKIPLKSGMLSGGNWNIKTNIGKITKNTQQWDGDVELNIQNVNMQYKVMETNYVALIREGKIKGKLINGLLNLDTTQINADIARITISGNTGINNPYNMNIQFAILPLEEFERKYPNENTLLKSVMQNQTEIIVNLSGPVAQMKPKVQNVNLPGF